MGRLHKASRKATPQLGLEAWVMGRHLTRHSWWEENTDRTEAGKGKAVSEDSQESRVATLQGAGVC